MDSSLAVFNHNLEKRGPRAGAAVTIFAIVVLDKVGLNVFTYLLNLIHLFFTFLFNPRDGPHHVV